MLTNCRTCKNIRICDEYSQMCDECERALLTTALQDAQEDGQPNFKKVGAVLDALLPKIQEEAVEDDNDFNIPDSDRRYHGDEYTGE
jgi:hypothetical protein